jgi:hypothetical protein
MICLKLNATVKDKESVMANVAGSLVRGRAWNCCHFKNWRLGWPNGLNKLEAAMQYSVAHCWEQDDPPRYWQTSIRVEKASKKLKRKECGKKGVIMWYGDITSDLKINRLFCLCVHIAECFGLATRINYSSLHMTDKNVELYHKKNTDECKISQRYQISNINKALSILSPNGSFLKILSSSMWCIISKCLLMLPWNKEN